MVIAGLGKSLAGYEYRCSRLHAHTPSRESPLKEYVMKDKVVAITGASSGIGEAIARHLAGRGAKLILGARRTDRLEKLASELGGSVIVSKLDVTQRASFQEFVAKAVSEFGRLDVLINNAGVMPLSPLEADRVEEWEQTIDVNVKGVLYGISAVYPQFRQQRSGHLINVSSVAGHIVFPSATVYCATKHAVRVISEGFRQESGPNIRTTILSPGAVRSELADSIKHEETLESMKGLVELAIEPEAMARAVAFAIEQPADVDVNELLVRPTAQVL